MARKGGPHKGSKMPNSVQLNSEESKSHEGSKRNNKHKISGTNTKSDDNKFINIQQNGDFPAKTEIPSNPGESEIPDLNHASETVPGRSPMQKAVLVLRAYMICSMMEIKGWAERQKPHLRTLTTVIQRGNIYIYEKFERIFPVIRAWTVNAGKLVFIVFMVWLDCSVRGLDSLLRMGTTSFFTLIWCGFLSIGAMIGVKKMLLFMVIAAPVTAFIGLGFAILITGIFSLIILWIYGSFWTTSIILALGGVSFALKYERIALLIATLYSIYCAKSYVGWIGLTVGLNLSFITGDVLIHFLKNNTDEERNNYTQETSGHDQDGSSSPQSVYERSADRGSGDPSSSGSERELTSEEELDRLINCTDHYSALGLPRFGSFDLSWLKREYRKKAMLVHPDKNMGNEKAAEAFKKLQNAYEVLLDSVKRKTYDDELRREELLNYFRQFQTTSQRRGRNGIFKFGSGNSEGVDEIPHGESRRIICKKCGQSHIWTCTDRSKSRARRCQDCKDFHQAKDGDGWLEQSFQSLLFGLVQKMDLPRAYVCADSKIYDVTDWFNCQGMRCPANTHKASFHVNTSAAKHSNKGNRANSNIEEEMTEEEFFEWLENAVNSGMFDMSGTQNENSSPVNNNSSSSSTTGGSKSGSSNNNNDNSNSSGSGKKKRKGKKQW